MAPSRGAERRAILLALLVAAAGTLGLGGLAALLLFGPVGATGEPGTVALLVPLGLLAVALAGFWSAITLLDQHFDDMERLRGALLIAAASGGDTRALQAVARGAGAEAERLAAAATRLAGTCASDRDRSSWYGERLSAIVAATTEPLVVLTGTGLVSLVNAAARQRLEARRVAVGTSVYAALEREPLLAAQRAAQAAGRAVPARLTTVAGEPLEAVVADLGGHDGLVLCLTGAAGEAQPQAPGLELDLGLHDAVPPMAPVEDTTPLGSLSALVLDTETTGLEVATARVVSLGAVRLQGARIFAQDNLDCLVRPDVPIPAASTAIHGIGDPLVADAPAIADVLPRLEARLGQGALVGHSIGYDLAILAEEAARCGHPWQTPPSLDTALLMAALEPGLRDLNLEEVAFRLGVAVEGRHTALGDALMTAEIFVRLLPRLEDAGIRTFGQARAFAERAGVLLARQRAAGWKH